MATFLPSKSRHKNFPLHAMIIFLTSTFLLTNCNQKEANYAYTPYVDTTLSTYGPYIPVKLPIINGVKIANPIQLALGPDSLLYAANQTGEVYSLRDSDGDGLEDMALLFCNVKDFGLRSPGGFAHRGDTIFVGTAQQIRAFVDKDKDGAADTSWVFFDDIPNSEHPYEWSSGLTFGPDNWLYFALTTDSWNAAPSPDPKGFRGSILKISPNGKVAESVATGIRSVYDMSFNEDGDLFFIDNEGGGNPTEELNLVLRNGFYGHNPKKYTFDTIVGPVHDLTTEIAPSAIAFNDENNDYGGTASNLFVAFYGPGERWTRGGVGRLVLQRKADGEYSVKEIPLADIPKLSGLAFGRDGSLYVSQHGMADYWYNAIYDNQGGFYKLIYDPAVAVKPMKTRAVSAVSLSESAIASGKQLFAEHACLGCHSMDGTTELLGPNLKDVGKRLSRSEILDEIKNPSARIKPSMMAVRVVKKNGQVILGRTVSADENYLTVMVVGNHVVSIARDEIEKTEDVKQSLMYDGLLSGLSEAEQQSLLDYMISLSAD